MPKYLKLFSSADGRRSAMAPMTKSGIVDSMSVSIKRPLVIIEMTHQDTRVIMSVALSRRRVSAKCRYLLLYQCYVVLLLLLLTNTPVFASLTTCFFNQLVACLVVFFASCVSLFRYDCLRVFEK